MSGEPEKQDHTTPLGLVPIPDNTLDRDISVLEGYLAFSAELVRLALLGIASVAFLLVQLDPGTKETPSLIRKNLHELRPWIYVALAGFGISSAAALGHRYCSNDGLACHVAYLRLRERGHDENYERVKWERRWRRILWRTGTWLLVIAVLALVIGVTALSAAFAVALKVLSG